MPDIDSVGIDNNSKFRHYLSVFPDSFPVFPQQFTQNSPRDRFYQGVHHPSPVQGRFVGQDMTCDGLADPPYLADEQPSQGFHKLGRMGNE